jgi:DNA-directed RNA polymerase specialized sigma24 family protein
MCQISRTSPTRRPIAEQELLTAECHPALREALTRLPPSCQQLLVLLLHDPPLPSPQISAKLGIPVGSIGPGRGRCLDRLRRDPANAALMNTELTNVIYEPGAEQEYLGTNVPTISQQRSRAESAI